MSEGLPTTAEGYRVAYRDVLQDIVKLASDAGEVDWDQPTGCPGWTVGDQFAHVTDLESILLGRPRPEHTVEGERPHVTGPVGDFTEAGVDLRRGRPQSDVVTELRDVVAGRLALLDSINDGDLDTEVQGFFGMSKLRSHLPVRIFDLWSHDQDVRRALNRPGDLDGPAARVSRELMVRGAAQKIQNTLAPAAGTSVLLEITGTSGATRVLTFDGERGRGGDQVPAEPTVTWRLDLPTLTVLACGRADDPDARNRVNISGDVELGRRMLADIAVTP
jgi:uncharacterized protein (TIGR03083 family)